MYSRHHRRLNAQERERYEKLKPLLKQRELSLGSRWPAMSIQRKLSVHELFRLRTAPAHSNAYEAWRETEDKPPSHECFFVANSKNSGVRYCKFFFCVCVWGGKQRHLTRSERRMIMNIPVAMLHFHKSLETTTRYAFLVDGLRTSKSGILNTTLKPTTTCSGALRSTTRV